jgi:toxin ParE1/3/4
VARLEDFPLSGRTVPEANQESIREIIFQGYRVMYWIFDEQRIDIVAVIHGSRDLQDPSNQPWDVT